VMRYLGGKSQLPKASAGEVLKKIRQMLSTRGTHAVDIKGLRALDAAEKDHAKAGDCIGEFKFTTNSDMLARIEKYAGKSPASVGR